MEDALLCLVQFLSKKINCQLSSHFIIFKIEIRISGAFDKNLTENHGELSKTVYNSGDITFNAFVHLQLLVINS